MTAAAGTSASLGRRGVRLPLPLRLALRDLRGGFSGFWIFLICIALGTGAIGAINSLSDAVQNSLAREGRVLLGGDAEATLVHRQANAEELAYLRSLGEVSEVATLRAMARKPDGGAQALVDLKAVDGAYPLYGAIKFEQGGLASVTQGGLALDRSVLDQLHLSLGDAVLVGNASFTIAAVIEQEPDRIAGGPAFGARILLSLGELKKTGLVEPGSLVRWAYRVKTQGGPLPDLKKELAAKFPEAGFLFRDSSDPSPGVRNTLQRLTEFLTLVGLTAMLTGGIGVANAVSSFVERRRETIAAFKALGASQRIIFRAFFVEIALLASLGVMAGFVIAAAVPWLIATLLSGVAPVAIEPDLEPGALALAALFGTLTALPFILWPLGRAQQIRAAELFRSFDDERIGWPPLGYRLASFGAVAALTLAAVLFSKERAIALYTCGALFAVFALFWGVGAGIRRLAASLKRPKRPEVALALANVGGPASLSRTIALSLGAGLTLLTAVSLVDASLSTELQSRLPDRAPSYFFIGVPKRELSGFEALLNEHAPGARVSTAPMLRGRLVALRGVPVEQITPPSNAEWVLNGDRGITYSEALPAGSEIAKGEWWPAAYEGEPLVSFEADIAKALGLKVGDMVTVNVLGRNLSAKIANFRKVRWGTIDINFVMIFSPNALRAAPFTYLATLTWPEGRAPDTVAEAAVMKALGVSYPTISAIRVRDALAAVNGIFEKVMRAVRIAGSVTLIMGALVMAGALIAAQRRRIYEAVVLRTLGASKRRIIAAHLLEYLGLAISLSAIAAALGLAAAYAIVAFVMNISFSFSTTALLQPSIIETIFVAALGALGTLRVLSAKPAHYLRSE
jgi:putative ABC transport system permease protein